MPSPVFLDESAYGRLVSRPDSTGWNKSIHLAKVDFGQGEEDAYVKLIFTPHWPALANEAIGWMLAHACEIACPWRAGVIVASADFWITSLGGLPPNCPQDGDIAAWCTSRCDTEDQHSWLTLDNDEAVLSMLKAESGRQLAAFDTWLLNIDRNQGNAIRLANSRWAAIDHEMLFDGLAGNWRTYRSRLNGKSFWITRLEELRRNGRLSEHNDQQIRSAMIDFARAHLPAIATTLPYLAAVLEIIEQPASAKSVLPLIVDRAWNFWMPATVNKVI